MVLSKLIKHIILVSFYLLVNLCYGQRADTTIHKRHYSFCSYYPGMYDRIGLETDEPKILFCLGNYNDTLKTGHWLYFFSSGKLMAQGDYEKGIKTGKWKYYSVDGDYRIVQFSATSTTRERIIFPSTYYAEIYDYIRTDKMSGYLLNGRYASKVFMLD